MYYVDRYKMELVKEKDVYAAPERYYEYRKGAMDDVIIETYIVSYNPLKLIDFAYFISDLDIDKLIMSRNNFFEKHGINGYVSLYAYTVPAEWYDAEVSKVNE